MGTGAQMGLLKKELEVELRLEEDDEVDTFIFVLKK